MEIYILAVIIGLIPAAQLFFKEGFYEIKADIINYCGIFFYFHWL
jgi:hypothetical protein